MDRTRNALGLSLALLAGAAPLAAAQGASALEAKALEAKAQEANAPAATAQPETISTLPKPEFNRFKSIYEMDAWSEHYYQRPDPRHFPAFIRTCVEQGRIGSSIGFALCCSFGREVVRQNPEYISQWHDELVDGTEVERFLLWNSIWWSGIPEGTEHFNRIRDGLAPEEQAHIDEFLSREPVELREEPIDRDIVSRCFGEAYAASGDLVFIDRLIEEMDAPPVDVMHPVVRQGFVMPEEQIYRVVMDELVLIGHRHAQALERIRASLNDGAIEINGEPFTFSSEGRPYMESVVKRIDEKLASEPSPDPSIGGRGMHADLIEAGTPSPELKKMPNFQDPNEKPSDK